MKSRVLGIFKLSGNNAITELQCNWHLVKEWLCSYHGNARNGHGVERLEAEVETLCVIILKGGDRLSNNLGFRHTHAQSSCLLE